MTYLLDTVTVSELRRSDDKMDRKVWQWQTKISESSLSVITLNELRCGMKKVERHDPDFAADLFSWYARIIAHPEIFRILNVDRAVAEQAADFRAAHGTPFPDSLIAATAKVHGLTLATRNTAHFEELDIEVVNPWEWEERGDERSNKE